MSDISQTQCNRCGLIVERPKASMWLTIGLAHVCHKCVEIIAATLPSASPDLLAPYARHDTIIRMDCDVLLAPGMTAQITQRLSNFFELQQIIIDQAEDWLINDIRLGDESLLINPGNLPASILVSDKADRFLNCKYGYVGMAFRLVATYEGKDKSGAKLRCAFHGLADGFGPADGLSPSVT